MSLQTMENKEQSLDTALASSVRSPRTISVVLDAIGYGRFQVLLSFSSGLAFLADAMEMMILSVLAPALHCSTWEVTKSQLAFLTTMVFLAMTITSPLWGVISDAYGRRRSLIISSVLLFLSGLVTAFSPTFMWLVALRFICGCFISCMPQCVTILLEYLPSGNRGTANIFMALIWALGGTLTILLAWACIPTWEFGWRILVALCTVPILLFLSLSFLIPESLLFLEKNGRREEVSRILESIARTNNRIEVLDETEIVYDQRHEENEDTPRTNTIIKKFKEITQLLEYGRRRTTILIWFIGILCGINYYGVVLFATELHMTMTNKGGNVTTTSSDCHILTSSDYLNLVWESLAEFPATLISLYVMDIIGRKKMLAINSGIFTLSLILLAIGIETFDDTVITALLFLARGTGVSCGWIYFVFVPESYPTEIRSIAFGVGSTCIRIGGMITPHIAQVLMEKSKSLALGVYILTGMLGTIAPMLLPVETKGIDLSSSESYSLLGGNK